jgi:ribonuclease G
MSEEILINVTPQETRIAVVENGVLQEIYIERTRRRGLVGNIYKGRVSRVLPGMQAAFVDIGLQRTAFLHASDIVNEPEAEGAPTEERRIGQIAELVKEGQELTVQVLKDPLGTKGARLTTQVTVPSRYLVLMPTTHNLGISQKVEDEVERQRLKDLVAGMVGDMAGGGYIIRTAAEGADAEALRGDIDYLKRLWESIGRQAEIAAPGSIIYEDMPLVLRALRDLVDLDVEKVRIDSRENYKKALDFAQQFVPQVAPRIEYYPGERPIFDLYGVEDEIQKALERKVLLKSGGYLIIDQTEAMTTIDVNTGAYVGHRTLEETIFKTNLEAAQAIARQLRLRNLGGIIIIDFIDMVEDDHKHQVYAALEKNLERDRAKNHISEVSTLGLVEMTRKRTRESLEHVLCTQCSTCQGRGSLKTPETVCYEIFRELLREARQFDVQQYLVLASQEVVDILLDEEATSLAELESFIGKPIKLQVESLYSQEQFDVVLM